MSDSSPTIPTEHVKEIFIRASEMPRTDRPSFLDDECGNDASLRSAIESLLEADESAGEFLAGPTAGGRAVAAAERAGNGPLQRIGPYKLLQVIGEGGFGTVYLAEQEHPVRRRVALKLVKLGMDTKEVIARFDAERQALAMMDHAHIARVFDAGATDNGRPYFAMELVRGVPIAEYCDRRKLDIPSRLRLFAQVCTAVQHAHTKGIIHRDLKPSNVLVSTQDDRPAPKIIDFGIAKATQARLTDKTLFTEYQQFIGSPAYMSPEQSEGSFDIDTRSDVYSLGAMLYELLTGATPFDMRELKSMTHAQIQQTIREVDPPKPSTRLSLMKQSISDVARRRGSEPTGLGTIVRGELDWIVMKAMEKDRARRYETAAALAADVGHYLNDEPVTAARPSRAYVVRKFVRRNRRIVAASAAVLVALLAGVIATGAALVGQARQRAIAEQDRAVAEAIGQFQADMLSSADPSRLLGDKVTVVQAVEAAVKELDDGKLKDQPLVEAGVRRTIGLTFASLGRHDAAEPCLRKALAIRRTQFAPDAGEIAQSATDLGLLLRKLGNGDEADGLFRDALAIRRKLLPPDHPDVASCLNNVALVLHDRGKLEQALPYYREALMIQRKAFGDKHEKVAQSTSNLGAILFALGEFNEAESLVREAVAIRRAALPPKHPAIAQTINSLATILVTMGKLDEAEKLEREGLSIQREVLPADHLDLASTLNNLAALLNARGKNEEALPLFRQALEIQRKVLPDNHREIASTLINLGGLLHDANQNSESEKCYREALELQRRGLPEGHPDLAWTYNMLAVLLQSEGRLAEAEPMLRESMRIRRAALPPGHPDIATSQNNLASLLRAQGKFTDAEALYREALDAWLKKLGPEHWQIGQVRLNLGRTLSAEDRFEEAEPELLAAERVLAIAPGTPVGRHDMAIDALATHYERWNKSAPSESRAAELNRWKQRLAATRPSTKP
ncbi:hypothetical protein BH09PLA1_BH09PLA1_11680 [soil metagenome]